MPLPSVFGSHIAAIMEVLAKKAAAEIIKLVEEESVVLHIEMSRKDCEIRDLERNLEMMKVELLKAQEAAANRITEEMRVGDRREEVDKMFAIVSQNMLCETHPIRAVVKEEPAGEPSTISIPADISSAAEQYDSTWPPTCAATQQFVDTFPFNSEEFSGKNSESTFSVFSTSKGECLTGPVKVEATVSPLRITTGSTPRPAHEALRHESLQSALQHQSPVDLPIAQISSDDSPECNIVVVTDRNNCKTKRQTNMFRTGQKLFVCPYCCKGFPRLAQLEEHRSKHEFSKPFECLECGKFFTQKTRLKTHQSVHTGERPFACKICGKRFSRHDNCLRHERFHSGRKPYSCEQCGKSFTTLGKLKLHQEIHLVGR